MEGLELSPGFWRGRRVFLTGHTGFKGSWTALWLNALGADYTLQYCTRSPGAFSQRQPPCKQFQLEAARNP